MARGLARLTDGYGGLGQTVRKSGRARARRDGARACHVAANHHYGRFGGPVYGMFGALPSVSASPDLCGLAQDYGW